MESIGSVATRGCSIGKVESPVASSPTGHELQTTNPEVTQTSLVTKSEEVKQLQNQVAELQKEIEKLQERVRYQDEVLQKADEMNREFLEIKTEHWLMTNELRFEREKLQQAQAENQRLRQENQELHNTKLPNEVHEIPLEAVRVRTLNQLKVGRQSAAGKAVDAFIKELKRELLPNTKQL